MPATKTWAAYDSDTIGGVKAGGSAPEGSATSGLEKQRSFIQAFAARGLENPEKQVTKRGFREHLVKAIIEDDLSYSLGEKPGMKKLFTYVLPRGFAIASHQTVRRDLDLLYEQLSTKINLLMQVCPLICCEQCCY
jgi:hypothetical protein